MWLTRTWNLGLGLGLNPNPNLRFRLGLTPTHNLRFRLLDPPLGPGPWGYNLGSTPTPNPPLRGMLLKCLQSSVSKFSYCVCRCVFASLDSRVFWLLSLSTLIAALKALWFCFLCPTYDRKMNFVFCVHLLTFWSNGWKFRNSLPIYFEKFEMWISSRWQQPPKCRAGLGG